MEKQSKKDLNIMYKRILVPTDGTPMSEKAVAVSYTHLTLPTKA